MNIPEKLRGFVIDRQSGRPLPGVVVFAVAEPDQMVRIPLGMLVSDAAGYVSFDLSGLRERGFERLIHLRVIAAGDPRFEEDVLVVPQDGATGERAAEPIPASCPRVPFLLKVDPRLAARGNSVRLPSVQNPDIQDWELSPYSFSVKSDLLLGEAGCEALVPSRAAEREYRFTQVVRTARPASGADRPTRGTVFEGPGPGRGPFTAVVSGYLNGLDPTAMPDTAQPMPIAFGEVLEFQQVWYPAGHALGAILYSTALAPCESVDIAVIEWSRKDYAARTDSVVSKEGLYHSQRRDRIIDESVKAGISESQGGWSLMGGMGGASSASVPVESVQMTFGATHALVALARSHATN